LDDPADVHEVLKGLNQSSTLASSCDIAKTEFWSASEGRQQRTRRRTRIEISSHYHGRLGLLLDTTNLQVVLARPAYRVARLFMKSALSAEYKLTQNV
jgi:hypothetical protein